MFFASQNRNIPLAENLATKLQFFLYIKSQLKQSVLMLPTLQSSLKTRYLDPSHILTFISFFGGQIKRIKKEKQ